MSDFFSVVGGALFLECYNIALIQSTIYNGMTLNHVVIKHTKTPLLLTDFELDIIA